MPSSDNFKNSDYCFPRLLTSRKMEFERIELCPTADCHVHLRSAAMMETVTPLIQRGGVDTVYVMV